LLGGSFYRVQQETRLAQCLGINARTWAKLCHLSGQDAMSL